MVKVEDTKVCQYEEEKPDLVKTIDGKVMYYCHKCRNGMLASEWKKHISKSYHKKSNTK